MSYRVKKIFYSLQGEGVHTGRPTVFCRFSGCNLWSGREKDRATAVCKFCDTEFVGGKHYKTATELADDVASAWGGNKEDQGGTPYVVCTGGEPFLQLDEALVEAFHDRGFEVAVETNGTILKPKVLSKLDWVCVSPKADSEIKVRSGDELKLVYPQAENHPEDFLNLEFDFFMIQPRDDDHAAQHLTDAQAYCLAYPKWRLSLQTHKILSIE